MADCEGGKMAALIPCGQTKLGWNLLCDELVCEILVRLPTAAAVRFQAVCKLWYSLISSPYFIARFRRRHTDDDVQSSSLVFRIEYSCDFFICDSAGCNQCRSDFQIISNSSSSLQKVYGESALFPLSYLPCPSTDLRLEGSFADLILCSYITLTNTNTYKIYYYVSNLLTRQWIALPPATHEGEFVSIGFLCVEDTSHHNKFMVFRLCSGHYTFTPRSRFKAQVFCSEKWLWRTFVVSSPLTLEKHLGGSSLVAYRGMLHWLNADCIVVYDPLNTPERFSRVIHLPTQLSPCGDIYRNNCFGVSQGCLRVTGVSGENTVNPDPVLDVWELEDYDSGLWNLVHRVRLQNLIHNGLLESLESELCRLSVLSLHPENGNVIYLRLFNGVVSINMKSRIIERFYPINHMAMFCWADAFHLVDQWWPTSLSLLQCKHMAPGLDSHMGGCEFEPQWRRY